MLSDTVYAVDFHHHIDDVNLDDLFAVNRELVVRALGRDFGRAAFALFVFAAVELLMTATHDHLNGRNCAGVIALE